MTTDMVARVRGSLESPEVNKRAMARIVPEDPAAVFLGYVTGAASPALAEPVNAWLRYLSEPGVGELDYEPQLVNVAVTGIIPRPWQEFGRLVPWHELRSYRPDVEHVGAGTIGSLLTWLVAGAEPVNVNTLITTEATEGGVTSVLPVNTDPIATHREALEHAEHTREAAIADIRRRLDQMRAAYAQRSPRDVVVELGDELGIGQLVIGRALGVTPTAVRKWRRGEPARAEHRDQLAKFAALIAYLGDVGLHDPASWIDIPVSADSTLKPLDLFLNRRSDLVVLLGAGAVDPQDALDEFEPGWRNAFTPDTEYEVVRLSDGSRSVVPRKGGSS